MNKHNNQEIKHVHHKSMNKYNLIKTEKNKEYNIHRCDLPMKDKPLQPIKTESYNLTLRTSNAVINTFNVILLFINFMLYY